MPHPCVNPVELLYRPAALLRMRPHSKGNYRQTCDVVYAEAHGAGLIMDVFEPLETPSGIGVVDIVSGGWHADRTMLNEHIGFGIVDALCGRGITVFAVSPGSITLFTGQEMVRHIHAAVRHIRLHAGKYGVKPEPLGMVGVSAGGHLASLAALAPQKARPEARDPWRRWSTDVSAVAAFFPPTDLVDYDGMRFDRFSIEGFDPMRLLFHPGAGGRPESEILERLIALSPARQPITQPPPFLIIQGKEDRIVPWEQAEKLARALRGSGGAVEVLYNERGGHVWPNISVEVEAAAEWLQKTLHPGSIS